MDEFFLGPDDNPDKYRLLQQFGAGGEAQLWRATLPLAGATEPVAVKVLRPELHSDFRHLSARWSEQAELLRFVQHPGVVGVREHFEGAPVHTAGQAANTPGRSLCLVMNWVDGHSLRDWVLLHPGLEGLVQTLTHLEQIAEVLDWLHSGKATPSGREIVHGDLSPGNIMISSAGQATLVDFGLARVAEHQTMAPAFTPGYAAPEVWNSGTYSPAGDRYGFGAIGYFLLTGESPPIHPAALRAGLAAVPIIAGGSPDRLDVLTRIFDPDPSKRPTALTWVRALRDGATTAARRFAPTGTAPVGVPPTARPPQQPAGSVSTQRVDPATARLPVIAPSPPKRRRRGLLVAAAVAVVALLGAGVLLGGQLFGGTAGTAAGAGGATTAPAAATRTSAAATTSTVPTTTGTADPTTSAGPSTAPVGSGAVTYLADKDPILGGWDRSGTIAVDGRTYPHALQDAGCGSSQPRNYEYNLGRAFTSFDTLLGMSDATDSSAQFKVEIFREGLPVGSYTLQRGKTEQVDLEIGGALTLKFTVSTIVAQQTCNGGLTLADPRLVS